MANDVYANGREISCKKADGKSICAFPDVCFTPPENPATPPGVPVPYPNTGMAKDTTKGSKKVKISGKEVILKNKSHFKKSYGDEAGSAAKKGVLTSTNRGKIYFTAWSMDVKTEGKNVVRHLDLTTHNHRSYPSNTCPWPYLDTIDVPKTDDCYDDIQKEKKACAGQDDPCTDAGLGEKPPKPYDIEFSMPSGFVEDNYESLQATERAAANECLRARRCRLEPYDKNKTGCCPGQTPHHLVEASAFFVSGRGAKGDVPIKGMSGEYKEGDAPCVCAEGTTNTVGSHGFMHTFQSQEAAKVPEVEMEFSDGNKHKARKTKYKNAKENGIKALKQSFPLSGCNEKCLERQLDNYHKQCGIDDNTDVKAVVCGKSSKVRDAAAEHARQTILNRVLKAVFGGASGGSA